MIGRKEFLDILTKIQTSDIYSVAQFEQLCKDSQLELNISKMGKVVIMRTINVYYALEWDYLALERLSRFIKAGSYRQEFKNVKV